MSEIVQIIQIASKNPKGLLEKRLQDFKNAGLHVQHTPIKSSQNQWPYTVAPLATRSQLLNEALLDRKVRYLWCARGGYGVSDLLPLIPWDTLKKMPPKITLGFSDISALQSALYTQLGWPSVHAPMPATSLWEQNSPENINRLLDSLNQSKISGTNEVTAIGRPNDAAITGTLFGGCLSVLTNLIGTPYLPNTLNDHILFFEDIDENPGRIFRNLNQWQQAGMLKNCKAIILGVFSNCAPANQEQELIYQEFPNRCNIPVFSSSEFGHIAINHPVGLGVSATIKNSLLTWQLNYQDLV